VVRLIDRHVADTSPVPVPPPRIPRWVFDPATEPPRTWGAVRGTTRAMRLRWPFLRRRVPPVAR
jgi:hypothetical protein